MGSNWVKSKIIDLNFRFVRPRGSCIVKRTCFFQDALRQFMHVSKLLIFQGGARSSGSQVRAAMASLLFPLVCTILFGIWSHPLQSPSEVLFVAQIMAAQYRFSCQQC